jgi:glutaconate CoA-transferase, subunit A
LVSMSEAVGLIEDGQLIAFGGNALHRTPAAFSRELARRKPTGLKICGAAHGYATDLLCASRAVDTVYFGFVGFENEYGLAPGMRKGCQEGWLRAVEGSCTAQIAALRGGAYGVPFMPVAGLWRSDLVALRPDFYHVTESPFTGEKVVCVRSLVPDFAVLHVQEADEFGNARILGPRYQDVLMARAARRTILTAERIVDTESLREEPKLTVVPYFLTHAVVHAPGGARPGICYPYHQRVDDTRMKAYLAAVKTDALGEYLDEFVEEEA